MTTTPLTWAETGLEVIDLDSDPAFAARKHRVHNVSAQREGLQRIAHAFVEKPETMLQVLVEAAVDLCGADSAGLSLEKADRNDQDFYHWIATAGRYSDFMNAMLPRYPSACGVCLERGKPQLFRVGQRFFDLLHVEAPLVTDGILLPWSIEETRGTIFIMAHGRDEVFDVEDCRTMRLLADFAAMGVRQQRQQKLLLEQAGAAAAAEMANNLAHQINNPLQSLTNIFFLASQGHYGKSAEDLGQHAFDDLRRLSSLVQELLALPYSRTS